MFRRIVVFLLLCAVCAAVAVVRSPVSREKRSDDVIDLTPVVSGLTQQMTQLQATVTALQNSLTQQQQLIQQLKSRSSVQASLHARLSSNHHYSSDNTIKFDTVLSNDGGVYDKDSGMFTAPVSGTYFFAVSAAAPDILHPAKVYLSINHRPSVYIDGNKSMATGHGVFHLTQGSHVFVAASTNNDMLFDNDSTFSGFLVKQDS